MFGIHEQALTLRTQRAALLANNLANVDTPNFKAKDLNFKAILRQHSRQTQKPLPMSATNNTHFGAVSLDIPDPDILYRTPLQPSIDGNTVDEQIEQAAFMKNAMDFEASFMFLNKRIKGIKAALRGD